MITISGGTPVVIIENGNERELMYNLPDEGGIVPTGSQTFTENGTYDVTEIAEAIVNVPEPTGSQTFTENGTYDVTAIAEAIVNVAGAGGLEYETGTYTPTVDTSSPTINFTNSHATSPLWVLIADNGTGLMPEGSIMFWEYCNLFLFGGAVYVNADNTLVRQRIQFGNKTSGASSIASANVTDSQYDETYVSPTAITPGPTSDNRTYRATRSYKWIAVWAPETGE